MARKHARVFDWALALLLACAPSCATGPAAGVPLVPRPDTRSIGQITFDSAAIAQTVAVFEEAFPNEAALCLIGVVRDTTDADGGRWLMVDVTDVQPAVSDSTDDMHVYFPAAPRSGCADHPGSPGLVGAAHSHTHNEYACTHSDPDADVLFSDLRLLFTAVFCGDGETEVLLQDGRRIPARWHAAP